MIDLYLRRVLDALRAVPGWPYDEKKDAPFLIELMSEFQQVDPFKLLRKWKAWLLDNPLDAPRRGTKKSNPRAQLRTQFECAVRYNWWVMKDTTSEILPIEEQMRLQDEKAAQRRRELGIA